MNYIITIIIVLKLPRGISHVNVELKTNVPSQRLPSAFTLVFFSAYSSTLKMEAIYSSETLVDFQRTTGGYIPEYSTLHQHIRFKIRNFWRIES
jgi:hypothetical protein